MKVAITLPSILEQKDRLGEAKLVAAFVMFFMVSSMSFSSVPDDPIKVLIWSRSAFEVLVTLMSYS